MFGLLWLLFSTSSSMQATQSLCSHLGWACLHSGLDSYWLSVQLPWSHLIAPRMWKLFSCVPVRETSVVTFFLPPNFLFMPCHELWGFFWSPAFCNNDGLTFSWNLSFPAYCLCILTFFTASSICCVTLAPTGVESKNTTWKGDPDISNIGSSWTMKLTWAFW